MDPTSTSTPTDQAPAQSESQGIESGVANPSEAPQDIAGLLSAFEKTKAELKQFKDVARGLAQQLGTATGDTSILKSFEAIDLQEQIKQQIEAAQTQTRAQIEAEFKARESAYDRQIREREEQIQQLKAAQLQRQRQDHLARHYGDPTYCGGDLNRLPQWQALAEMEGFQFEWADTGECTGILKGGVPLRIEDGQEAVSGGKVGDPLDPKTFAFLCRSGRFGPVLQSFFPSLNNSSGASTPASLATSLGGNQVFTDLDAFNRHVAKLAPKDALKLQQDYVQGRVRFQS